MAFAPMIRLPEIGSDERLRAMKEALIDSHAGGEDGRPTPGGQSIEELRIASELGATVDSKGLRRTRNHEDQTDVRVFEDVEMPEHVFVSRSIGNSKSLVVFDESEARAITLG